VKKVIKLASLLVALLLVVVVQVQRLSETEAATVAPADGTVAWAASNGDDITATVVSTTAAFFINAAALETSKGGTATFGTTTAATFFEISNVGAVGTSSATSTTGVTYTLVAADYNSSTPSATPLTGDPTVVSAGSTQSIVGRNLSAGTFTLFTASSATTTATFNYHIVDTYTATLTSGQAKVTSTSDPDGEYVTISEVASATDSSPNATSRLFRGTVVLTSDPSKQGTNADGVYVSDANTITVTYLSATDTLTADGGDPSISNLSPADGTITKEVSLLVEFDVTDTGSGIASTPATAITLAINGIDVGSENIRFGPITDGYHAIFAQGSSWLNAAGIGSTSGFGVTDSTMFSLTITATDQAGNIQTLSGTSAEVTIDETAPTISSAVTGSATTAVTVTFSEALDATTIDADGSDFTVGAVAATAAVVDADNGAVVNLTVTALATDAKPEVKVVTTDGLKDKAGNSVVLNSVVTAADGTKPAVTITIDKALAITDGVVKVTAVTDEKLRAGGLIVSINGTLLSTSAATPLNNEGSRTIVAGDASGQYGVAIQAQDIVGNTFDNLTAVTAEAHTLAAGTVVTLANGPIADADFDGDVDSADITAFTVGGSTPANFASSTIDASARTITLVASVTGAVLVTYKYVASDVFEVDQAAPTIDSANSEPDDGDTIQNTSPFVRITFDEDEYPGDSYTTVTLTKAQLTDPAGVTSTVAASFVTSDNKEYIWAASNLALGAHKLTITATDNATNALTDTVINFTVAKRTQSLSLKPGWNLVSLADVPATTTVGGVFADSDITTVVTYDPTDALAWLTATRGSDGTFGGTLSNINGSTGYWVFSNDFVSLSVDVPGLTAGTAALPTSYNLVAGWNLLPIATSDLVNTTRDPDEYFTGLSWSRALGYDNTTNAFTSILPAKSATDVANDAALTVGQGYWVYLRSAGTLVPD
jgi:hypothetical protein